MTRLRTRMLAAGTTLLIAATASLTALAPATAEPLGMEFETYALQEGRGRVTGLVPEGSTINFIASLDGIPEECRNPRPDITYELIATTPDGTQTVASGTFGPSATYSNMGALLEYRYQVPSMPAATSYEFKAASQSPCFPDGQQFSHSVTVYTPLPWAYHGETSISGVVYEQTVDRSTDPADYVLAQGVEVALLDLGDMSPVDTAVTDADGAYDLTATVENEGDEYRSYVVVVIVDDEFWFYSAGASAALPSEMTREYASVLSPIGFDPSTSYDVFAGTAARPSRTDWNVRCWGSASESDDVHTGSVDWYDVCLTDPTIDAADTRHRWGAFDGFGDVTFVSPDGDNEYRIAADEQSVSSDAHGTHLLLRDEAATVYDADGALVEVDVVVERTIAGSWMSWDVKVYLAGTTTLATDVPFVFSGDTGSDSGTEWHRQGSLLVSTDSLWADEDRYAPILGHDLRSAGTVSVFDEDDEYRVAALGSLDYRVAVMDYCSGDDLIGDAFDILTASATLFGTDLDPLGDVCPPDPEWSIAAPSLREGVAYDATFTAPSAAPWDWSDGGSIELWGLPLGLDYEVLDEWTDGVAPRVRIFGTPERSGAYDFSVYLQDDLGHEYQFDVAGTIAVGVPATWAITAPTFRVGEAYDVTITAPRTAPWNWRDGGSIWIDGLLPEGIDYEVLDEWESGEAPRLRLFGTPLWEGPYSFDVRLEDDFGKSVRVEISGNVSLLASNAERDLGLELKIAIGDQIAGAPAEATAEGLEEGADYDIVVRSTPQTLAVGTVPVGGTVTRGITLPTLEAGWHSLTFTSTWAGGGTAVAKLWFQVSADGTLLAISRSAPAGLANTGADVGGSVTLASFALLLGFGMVAFRRRRSARV